MREQSHENIKTTFILLRHGEAEQNVLDVLNGVSDVDRYALTERGRTVVRETAKEIALESVDNIFTSPLRRTRETAEIVHEATGAPVVVDDRLRELDFGLWEGQKAKDFWAKYPDKTDRIDGDFRVGLEGGRAVHDRTESFVRDVLMRYAGRRVVVVSHGDTLQQLHGVLIGEDAIAAIHDWYPERGIAKRVEVISSIPQRDAVSL